MLHVLPDIQCRIVGQYGSGTFNHDVWNHQNTHNKGSSTNSNNHLHDVVPSRDIPHIGQLKDLSAAW